MDLHQGRLPRGPGVAVADQDGHRFLQRQNVLELRIGVQRVEKALLDGAGVAEHVAEPVGKELFQDGEPSLFWLMSYPPGRSSQRSGAVGDLPGVQVAEQHDGAIARGSTSLAQAA